MTSRRPPTRTDTFEGWISFWHDHDQDPVAVLTTGLDKAVQAGVITGFRVGAQVDHNSGADFSQHYLRIVLPEAQIAEEVPFWAWLKANSGLTGVHGSLYATALRGKGCFPEPAAAR